MTRNFLFGGASLVFLILLALFSSTLLEAQVAGTISGYVRDESGGVIPGAEVTAISEGQQLSRSVVADATGFFNLLAMRRGVYSITVEMPAFEKQTQQGVQLTAGDNVRLDFVLKVGGADEEVTVHSRAVMVDTKTPTMSGLIDDQRVQDLPLNGRNVISLARILPGAVAVDAPQEMEHTRDGPNMSVNGGTKVHNLFTFNGANFTSFAQTTGFNPPPPDAVEEIRIQTHNFTAEYGHNSGSQVSVISKSGSNDVHGSAWWFHRNDVLNARSFFQPRKPGQRQNQAGGALGGPLLRDKLFGFGSYQRLWNRREAGSSQAFVPTDAQRAGDFSGSSVTLTNPVDPITGLPFADGSGNPCVVDNRIAPGCISPVAKNYLDQFIPTSPTGTFVRLTPTPSNSYNWMSRVDYVMSSKNTLFGHYFRDHYDRSYAPGSIEYVTHSSFSDVHSLGISDTHTFSTTFLNEATFSYLKSDSLRGPETRLPPRDMGINIDEGPLGRGMNISVSGRFGLSFEGLQEQNYENWHLRETMTKISGRHTLKWGYEFVKVNFHLAFSTDRNVTFNGVQSGDPTADFLLGAFDSATIGFGLADSDPIIYKHMFFVQDEFKIVPRFTLNFGVRYEPWFPWIQKFDHYTGFDPNARSVVKPDAPPGVLFPGDPGIPEAMTENDLNNFAPRVGFAWDLAGNGRTVVRGGYGLFYNQISANSVHAAEAPWRGTVPLYQGRIEDPFGSLGMVAPPSGAPLAGDFGCVESDQWPYVACPMYPLPLRMVFTEPKAKTPYAQAFNLSFQRQIAQDWMLDLAYVGKIGTKLEGHRHFNPAAYVNSPLTGKPPSSQNVNERTVYLPGIISPLSRVMGNDYRSWYHSMQVKLNKRFTNGFSLLSSYVLSKAIDSVLSGAPGLTAGVANPFDLSTMRGRGQYDHRHVLAVSWVWDPRFRFANPVVNGVLGGWNFTGIHRFTSGAPLTFTMGTDVALDGTGGSGRQYAQLADGMTRDDVKREHTSRNDFITQFFNTSAFMPTNQVPKGTYGNSGRNIISGPADAVSDFTVMKHFPIREELRMQLRGEFFNAFNQVNFGNPSTSVRSGSFGRITSAGSGRVIQLALKFLW